MKLDSKVTEALSWITTILEKNNISYQISGGFAGCFFGSQRKLNDIDIDISENDFDQIIDEIRPWLVFGPSRYKDDKWDLYLMTIHYHGQEIDISGIETCLISSKDRKKWIHFTTDFNKCITAKINDINIPIIDPSDFVLYKKELDGEHQLEDIIAAENYSNNHPKKS